MTEVISPDVISYAQLIERKSLSPINYNECKIPNKNKISLYDLLEQEPIKGDEIGSNAYADSSSYFFMRTQAIRNSQFTLSKDSESFVPCKKQDFDAVYDKKDVNLVRSGGLFYVKGGNVGEVALAVEDVSAIFSSHIFKLIIKKKYRNYVFAVLKSSIGKMQIANLSPGSIEGLDSFKVDYLKKIGIPMPVQENREQVIDYVNRLVDSCLTREKEIRIKFNAGMALMSNDIAKNRKGKEKRFAMPTFNDLMREKRLDTRIYSETLQKHRQDVKQYANGYYQTLDDEEAGFKISRGQNLQESGIGISVYLDRAKKGYVRLVLSSTIGLDFQYSAAGWLGNHNRLKRVQYGDVIFTCRGDMGRVIVYLEEDKNTITNIDNVHIRRSPVSIKDSITLGFYLSYLREKGVINDIAIAGSGAGSFTKYHFDRISMPKFSDDFKNQITRIYSADMLTLDGAKLVQDDDKIVPASGIYQLTQQLITIKEIITNVVSDISDGKKVSLFYPKLD